MSENLSNKLVLDEYKQQVADYFNSRTNYDDSDLAQKRARNTWNGKTWLYPDNPLLKLPTSITEQIKAEYDTQIEALATEKGVWWDITTFLAIGHKA